MAQTLKTQKPMKDININMQPTAPSGKAPAKRGYLRTCGKCSFNAYSPGQYSQHMAEKHDKNVPKSSLTQSRIVSNGFKKAALDVPEEILVKPKKVDPPKNDVAKSRRGRQSAETPKESTAPVEAALETPKPVTRRKRRTKEEMNAAKSKGK